MLIFLCGLDFMNENFVQENAQRNAKSVLGDEEMRANRAMLKQITLNIFTELYY